jgi:hypothetical protein
MLQRAAALGIRGDLPLATGRPVKALASYEEARAILDAEPGSARPSPEARRVEAHILSHLALLHRKHGRHDAAARTIGQALASLEPITENSVDDLYALALHAGSESPVNDDEASCVVPHLGVPISSSLGIVSSIWRECDEILAAVQRLELAAVSFHLASNRRLTQHGA